MKVVLFLLAVLAYSGSVAAQVRSCESQEAAVNQANAAYEKENTPAKKLLRPFQSRSLASFSMASSKKEQSMRDLTECRTGQANDQQAEKDMAKQRADYAAYAATPEGSRRIAREEELNKVSGGRLDMASFTPRQYVSAVVDNPWKGLGENETTKYWYTYWVDRQMNGVAVVLKGADKGIGDNFTTVRFVSGYADCLRNPGTYPSYLVNTSVEVDDASTGYPPPGYSDLPIAGSVPLQRGTSLAEAVKQSCDRAAASR